MKSRFALLAALASFSLACGREERGTSAEALPLVNLAGTPVDVAEIRVNPAPQTPLSWYSGYTSQRRLVIRTAVEWAAEWETIFGTQSSKPPLPQVDFAREMVIVSAAGIRGSSGYSITVRNAALDGAMLSVGVIETLPGADCVLAPTQTSPVYAVRIARFDGQPVFVNESIVVRCGP